jgi:hypothetical protein
VKPDPSKAAPKLKAKGGKGSDGKGGQGGKGGKGKDPWIRWRFLYFFVSENGIIPPNEIGKFNEIHT